MDIFKKTNYTLVFFAFFFTIAGLIQYYYFTPETANLGNDTVTYFKDPSTLLSNLTISAFLLLIGYGINKKIKVVALAVGLLSLAASLLSLFVLPSFFTYPSHGLNISSFELFTIFVGVGTIVGYVSIAILSLRSYWTLREKG